MPFTLTRLIGDAFSRACTAVFGESSEKKLQQPPKKTRRRERKDYSDPYLFTNEYRIDTVINVEEEDNDDNDM